MFPNYESKLGDWQTKEVEKPKIIAVETLNDIQKTNSQQNFVVKISLNSYIGNNKLIVELDGRIFSTYQKNTNIKELNTFFSDVIVDFSTVVRLDENFKLIVKIIDLATNQIVDSKFTTVKVESNGKVKKSNESMENIHDFKKDVLSTPTSLITIEQLIEIGVSKNKANEYIDSLNKTLQDYKIDTDLKIIHFIAQVMSESISLNATSEKGKKDSDYNGFKGRGLIQITGKNNYKAYEDYENEDFTSSLINKEKLEKIPYSVRSAGWYWDINAELNDEADKNDFIYCTFKINGGFNGFDLRLSNLKRGFKALNIDYINFDFQTSKINNNIKACFAWGIWNDPAIIDNNKKYKLFDSCTNNKEYAIAGYKRVIDLVDENYNLTNWYGIQNQKEFENLKFIKNKKSCVKILDAAKQRLLKLTEK